MAKVNVIEYGHGGYDPLLPNQNVLATELVAVPDEYVNAPAVSNKIAAAIDALELADTNWPSLTAGQKDAALRLAVRGVAKLGRIQQGRFDAA